MRCPDVSVNNVHETGNTRANFVFREVGSGEGDQAFGSNIFVALHVHVWTVCSTASVISLLCIIFIEPMFGVISRWWPEPTVLWNRTNSSLLDSQKTKQNKNVVPAVRKHVVVFLLFSFFFKNHFKTHSFHSTRQERSFISSVFYKLLDLSEKSLWICLSGFQQWSVCTLMIFVLMHPESVWNVQSCPL